jgi:hypothetical protein
MTNPKSGGGAKGSHMAHDGHRPLPQTATKGYQPSPPNAGGKVQGGYQAPAGGAKPATPTTGSGVAPAPAAPAGGKK